MSQEEAVPSRAAQTQGSRWVSNEGMQARSMPANLLGQSAGDCAAYQRPDRIRFAYNRNTSTVRNSARTQRLLSRVVLMPRPWGRAVVPSTPLPWLLCS